ncbi:MAG: helix-turn-helix transcriptional regulator [Bacteroidaceae bacterium]|nr:helix-turn-helix transcriptional regulator [Bacteroidaceae bacterium]
MNTKTLDQIKDEFYGERGTQKREKLENELQALRVGLQIREARKSLHMTQEQLAAKIDKKRTFISKVENDGSNITLQTLYDIVERGLGGKLRVEVSVGYPDYEPGPLLACENH